MLQHNQTRMQNRPWCREEIFIAKEKAALGALPEEIFEINYYKTYKVQQNIHILLGADHHFYSVPYIHIGQNSKVIYTRSIVRILVDGQCVAVHPRDRTSWGYSTVTDHLCSIHRHYLSSNPGYYIRRAGGCSDELYRFFQLLFDQNKPPEQL